ncbi:beta-hexosaminidase B-like [Aplysia californica]|uniref:beta-N-acetylhexosaminidase n=1 Tax=Aplysia californica TaxID=6500 RepID=A0ABM1AFL4_APLCA|nr:beta-hexosaminidase B-like [Aplysia californica]
MAMYKLNKLHLHLTDDEGWRIDIPGLEELTQVGAKRCHDVTETRCLLPFLGTGPYSGPPGSGFYTVEDYRCGTKCVSS